jgi:diguanylate cyclase (GGDEF)-like protein/PAS domain S-box-containing protein
MKRRLIVLAMLTLALCAQTPALAQVLSLDRTVARPSRLLWALVAALALLLSTMLAASWLRRQVRARTRELADSERKLASILDSVESLIYIKDRFYRYQYVNAATARWFGKPAAEIVGKNDFELFERAAAEGLHQADLRVIKHAERVVTEEYKPGGKRPGRVLLSTKIPLASERGGVYGLCGISTDITERKRLEDSLRVAATVFQSQEGMFVLGPDQRFVDTNDAYSATTGWSATELTGTELPPFSLDQEGLDFRATMWRIVERLGKWQGEIVTWRKNGSEYPAWLTITAVHDAAGKVSNYVGTHTDITDRKQAEEKIAQLAYYDALTGLPNRQLLIERLQHCLSYHHRSRQLAALLFLDLDNFKDLNDTRGHAMGDVLLQQVAARIAACARESDTVARLGGDEFVIVLEAVGSTEEEAAAHADVIGRKILHAVGEPYLIGEDTYQTTCSIGVALCCDDELGLSDLMRRGDLAMYQAKRDGRNCLRFFERDMESLVNHRTALEAEMRTALREPQFELYYQGQINGHGQVIGAEALLRWRHPQRGVIDPSGFIAIAERSRLILPLGHWVLESACAQLARWATSPEMARLTLAVNISVPQLLEPDFVEQTLAIIAASGANPARLKLELTESLMIDAVEQTIDKMHALKAHGVGFSLDDFGTGYSSLSYLKRLPLDQLKIDRSFVRDVLDDPNDASIAQSVVALAKALGLGIIAEGVETNAQRDFLAGMGCDTWQGYLFSPPVRSDDFTALVH